MTLRLPAPLPRAAVIVLVALGATATLTYAAGRGIGSSSPPQVSAPAIQATVVVPDVRNQAYVFAKGTLADGGLGWRVAGAVHGYSANTVVSQTPAPGTKLLDTGAPLVTLTLKRNKGYSQVGDAEDASPYAATAVLPVALASRPLTDSSTGPAAPASTTTAKTTTPKTAAPATTAPVTTTTTPAKPAKPVTAAKPAAAAKPATWPQVRPAAFAAPGAAAEPLDEMPLPNRAQELGRWVETHRKPTDANVKYWLYQHQWIVTGAKLGWWRGAEALQDLIAVDKRTQSVWGIGAKSAKTATAALSFVEARSNQ
jgi:hypothetical protein